MSDEATVERVARAIYETASGPWEFASDYGQEMVRSEARAAIAAMSPAYLVEHAGIGEPLKITPVAALSPQVSPELIEKLGKLANYLTEQGEYEACDLIDTVVERLTPKAKG